MLIPIIFRTRLAQECQKSKKPQKGAFCIDMTGQSPVKK